MRKVYPAIVFWKQDLAHNVAGPKHLNLTSWLTCFENRRNISQREVIVTSKALVNLLTNAQHSSWRGKVIIGSRVIVEGGNHLYILHEK